MALTPNNFRMPVFGTLELTSALNNAAWSVSTGASLIASGSNSYKRNIIPHQPGALAIQAAAITDVKQTWAGKVGDADLQADGSYVTTSNNGNFGFTSDAILNNTTDALVWEPSMNYSCYIYDSAFQDYFYCNTPSSGGNNFRLYSQHPNYSSGIIDVPREAGDKVIIRLVSNGSGQYKARFWRLRGTTETLIGDSPYNYNTFSPRIGAAATIPVGSVIQPFFKRSTQTESASGYAFQAKFALGSVWYTQGQTVNVNNVSSIAEGTYSFLWTLNGLDISTAQNLSPLTGLSAGVNTLTLKITEANNQFSTYTRTFFVGNITGASSVEVGQTAQYAEANISDKVWHLDSADPNKSTISQSGLLTANKIETCNVLLRNYLITQLSSEVTVEQLGASATVAQNIESQPAQYVETMKDAGDEITWTKGAAGSYGFALYQLVSAGTVKAIYLGHGYFYDYSGGSVVSIPVASAAGDVLKMKVMPDYRLGLYKNGVLQTQTAFPINLTGNNRLVTNLYLYQTPIGTVIPKPIFSGSGYGGLKYAAKQISTFIQLNANFSLPAEIVTGTQFSTVNASTGSIASRLWKLNGENAGTTENLTLNLSPGNHSLELIVTETGTGATDSHTINFTVRNVAPGWVTNPNLGTININEPETFNLQTSGGNAPLVIELQSGQSLPVGVTLNGSVLTINRALIGAIEILLRVRDVYNRVSNRTFILNVIDPYDIPPEIVADSPLPYAQTGKSYAYQFRVDDDDPIDGTFSVVLGNLPENAVSPSGALYIATIGTNNYTFTLRYAALDGAVTQESFTIPVSPYAAVIFSHKRPLAIKEILKQRIFEPVEGDDEVAEDAAPQYEFTINTLYVGAIAENELRDFLEAHRKRQKFLWVNPDRHHAALLVKRVSGYDQNEMLTYGNFEFTIRTIDGLNYV